VNRVDFWVSKSRWSWRPCGKTLSVLEATVFSTISLVSPFMCFGVKIRSSATHVSGWGRVVFLLIPVINNNVVLQRQAVQHDAENAVFQKSAKSTSPVSVLLLLSAGKHAVKICRVGPGGVGQQEEKGSFIFQPHGCFLIPF
jgi:hypothetical protein